MWALGVICYILLSGFSPFMGDSDTETYNNISSVTYNYECEEFDDICENAKVRPPCIMVVTNPTFQDFISCLLKEKAKLRLSAQHVTCLFSRSH